MVPKTAAIVVAALQSACTPHYELSRNPNALHCLREAGAVFAIPLDIETDCWDAQATEVVLRGVAPASQQNRIDVAVMARYAEGPVTPRLTAALYKRWDDDHCALKMHAPDIEVRCMGSSHNADGVVMLHCRNAKGDCTAMASVPAPWDDMDEPVLIYSDQFPAHDETRFGARAR